MSQSLRNRLKNEDNRKKALYSARIVSVCYSICQSVSACKISCGHGHQIPPTHSTHFTHRPRRSLWTNILFLLKIESRCCERTVRILQCACCCTCTLTKNNKWISCAIRPSTFFFGWIDTLKKIESWMRLLLKNEDELIPNCIHTQEELLCYTSQAGGECKMMVNHQNYADVTRGRIRSNRFKVVQTTNDTHRSAVDCTA